MSGIELIRERLTELGLNKAATHNKGVELTVAIIANGDDVDATIAFKELIDEYHISFNTLNSERAELNRKQRELSLYEKHLSEEKERISKSSRILEEQRIQLTHMIDDFKDCLCECETAEGRDAARKTAFYIANTNVNTAYDNTAFINGLAVLLSDTQSNLPDNIKKVITDAEKAVSPAKPIIR